MKNYKALFEESVELLAEAAILLRTCQDTYEVQTQDSPWSDNKIMEGCIRGSWLDTPKKIKEFLSQSSITDITQ